MIRIAIVTFALLANAAHAELVEGEPRELDREAPPTIRRTAPPAPEHRIDFGNRIGDPRANTRGDAAIGARRLDSIRPAEPRGISRGESSARTDAPARSTSTAIIDGRDTGAMIRLGLDYYRGGNGPRNYAEAYRMFEVAGEHGDTRGKMAAAYMRGEGLGVARDPTQAKATLDTLRRQGVGRAAYLRVLLEESTGSPKDKADRVRTLLHDAATTGDAFAQNLLGIEYERQGTMSTARLWYAEAARGGSSAGTDNLARMDARSAKRKAKRSVVALEQEAERGDATAAFELAQRYHKGDGVSTSYADAVRWYQLAASREYGPAKQMTSLIYSEPAMHRGIDPVWMRRLAQISLPTDGSGARLEAIADGMPVREPDPLFGLEALKS